MGATAISDNGKGKGDALRVAFEYPDDDVVFVDVDDTYPVERIPEFISALKDYDLVIGERTGFIAGSLPLLLRIGDWVWGSVLRWWLTFSQAGFSPDGQYELCSERSCHS